MTTISRNLIVPVIPGVLVALSAASPAASQVAAPDTLAQTPGIDTGDVPEILLEDLVEEAVAADPADLLELVQNLAENPVDLNLAGHSELAAVPEITPRLAAGIVQHRAEHGPFDTVDDLLTVAGFEADVLEAARPYVFVSPPGSIRSRFSPVPALAEVRRGMRVEVLQRMQRRLEVSRGYDPIPDSLLGSPDEPRRYLGSPERVYTRLRATYRRNVSANLTLEKDPGEPFAWDPARGSYGYDFASFHLAAMRMGRIEALVVGDYVAEFGQGLTLWRASGFGKGREPIGPLVRNGRGIRPYGSTDENRFFRGTAMTVAVTPSLFATGFVSRRRYDARFAEVDTASVEGLRVAVMPTSGLHRTRAELDQKNALGQTLGGGAVELRLTRAAIGAVAYQARFDEPLGAGAQPYQRFAFEGDRASMLGLFGHLALGDYLLFGEAARSPGGSIGGVGGAEAAVGPLQVLLLARHYPRDFISLHGYAFGERNGVSQNETGLYLGTRLRPTRTLTFSGYFDQFRFPWARFGVNRPSLGHDALLAVDYRPRPWLTVYAQGRSKTRETGLRADTATGAVLDALTEETRRSLRLQVDYQAGRDVRLRTRVEGADYRRADDDPEHGILLFHDVRWAPARWLILDGRVTYFETGGFGARLYQFENDLYGVMTNALLYGRGTRLYAVATVRAGGRLDGLDARMKLAVTSYRDRHSVGSGLDQIDASTVHDLGLQLRYRFGGKR